MTQAARLFVLFLFKKLYINVTHWNCINYFPHLTVIKCLVVGGVWEGH